MIPIERVELDGVMKRRLEAKSALLRARRAGTAEARQSWRSARTIRRGLAEKLTGMAPGLSRCMYCGDGEGTDIDHFRPIASDPFGTFLWTNHLLACSHCNSNMKRDKYPCDASGSCLLVDPCRDDPHEHMELNFATGIYFPLTAKGASTIEVFGLGRPVLVVGRAKAFVRCKAMLSHWLVLTGAGDDSGAEEVYESLRLQPFADVLYAMVRRRDAPGAPVAFGREAVAALRAIRW
ncbi:HNH endonuclease [Streptacidiphilus sp. 4-A2]|nr:HNH endonuclease [Streptacidiphilus sp. 4-A2]